MSPKSAAPGPQASASSASLAPQPHGGAPGADLKAAIERPASFLQTVKAVAWSFFGVRRRAGYEQDVKQLNPVHVIMAGLLAAALFVATLMMIVRWVVGTA
ncbi:MAG: DUF2970 domain-containing protein [Rubrivivax sp.]|nr:DUF2970 domain-containing protein [Rubrivivax sp.]